MGAGLFKNIWAEATTRLDASPVKLNLQELWLGTKLICLNLEFDLAGDT
jgi:hypothetical protein